MYRCSLCGKCSEAGAARQLLVFYKEGSHPYRPNAGKRLEFKYGKWRWEWYPDQGGRGRQIEREIPVCLGCKAKHDGVTQGTEKTG